VTGTRSPVDQPTGRPDDDPPAAPSRGAPGFVGVVPAAGRSRRMGHPKALLDLEGETFLRRVVRILLAGGCERVAVVARPEDDGARREAADAGAHLLVNRDPGDGPITSLRCAITSLRPLPDSIVWLPVDHPCVSPVTVRALIDAALTGDAPITLPVHGNERGHPAVFSRSVYDELLDPGLDGGARTVVHRHLPRARLVPTDDRGVLIDIDTQEDYRAVLGRNRGVTPEGGERPAEPRHDKGRGAEG